MSILDRIRRHCSAVGTHSAGCISSTPPSHALNSARLTGPTFGFRPAFLAGTATLLFSVVIVSLSILGFFCRVVIRGDIPFRSRFDLGKRFTESPTLVVSYQVAGEGIFEVLRVGVKRRDVDPGVLGYRVA